MQGRGFSRTRRTDCEHHAIRTCHQILNGSQIIRTQVHLAEGLRTGTSEYPEDNVLVFTRGRQGHNAQLDFHFAELEANLAILGHAALGNIEPGHDLDSGHKLLPVFGRDSPILAALSVDSEANRQIILLAIGLNMDVRCPVTHGIQNNLVGQPNGGRVFPKVTTLTRF